MCMIRCLYTVLEASCTIIYLYSGFKLPCVWYVAFILYLRHPAPLYIYTVFCFQVVFEATHNSYRVHRYSNGHYHYDNYNQNGNIALDDVYIMRVDFIIFLLLFYWVVELFRQCGWLVFILSNIGKHFKLLS
jgi:hypothetical protein